MEERLMQNAPLDEAQIMVIAQHNPALFAPLYERYVDRVYAYCRRRAANDQDAEDLCSMVFARAGMAVSHRA
jgi:DNA-directed RNA polymerase specialized sigma24 family protein